MNQPVTIPADVDVEDRVLGRLTARQGAVLAGGAVPIWVLWNARDVLGTFGFCLGAIPLALLTVALAFARHDGVGLDRLAVAAARQRLAHPTHRPAHGGRDDQDIEHPAGGGMRAVRPVGPVRRVRPSLAGTGLGVVEVRATLGERVDALAVAAEVAPVNLALRNPGEQEALVAGFARWLHALHAPVQIVTRTRRADLNGHLVRLHHAARHLPPALAAAADDHAAHLAYRAAQVDLLERRTYVVLSTTLTPTSSLGLPGAGGGSGGAAGVGRVRGLEDGLRRRLAEAHAVLGAAGLVLIVLDTDAATDLLTSEPAARHLDGPVGTDTDTTGPLDGHLVAPVQRDDHGWGPWSGDPEPRVCQMDGVTGPDAPGVSRGEDLS